MTLYHELLSQDRNLLQGTRCTTYIANPIDSTTLELTRISPDGDENFPGNVTAKVLFKLTDDNAIDIKYSATTGELIAPLSQQAMDLGFDGLIIEAHCTPDSAWSDKAQQVTPDALAYILRNLVIREQTTTTENLNELRAQIDKLDDQLLELLVRRMRVSRDIGQYKKEHDMPILQTQRYEELLARRAAQAVELGMDREFMRTVLQAIHEESVRQQMEVLGK